MQKAPIKNPEDPLNQNSEIILDSLAQASKESNVPLIDALLSSDLVIEADWEFRALTKHDLRFLALISAIQENRPHIALTICNSRQFHRFVVSSSSEDLYALFKQLAGMSGIGLSSSI